MSEDVMTVCRCGWGSAGRYLRCQRCGNDSVSVLSNEPYRELMEQCDDEDSTCSKCGEIGRGFNPFCPTCDAEVGAEEVKYERQCAEAQRSPLTVVLTCEMDAEIEVDVVVDGCGRVRDIVSAKWDSGEEIPRHQFLPMKLAYRAEEQMANDSADAAERDYERKLEMWSEGKIGPYGPRR